MALRLLFRSYGGENMKGRPEFYSKILGLLSFLRAAEGLNATPVYMNDGPIPPDRLRVMEATGEIVQLPGLGMRGSYLTGLRYAADQWDDDDVVWFSEDDYLYRPEALRRLMQAFTTIPEAEYFALYASLPTKPVEPEGYPRIRRPAGWRALSPWIVDGQPWVRVYSTASTFGARVGALGEDLGIFRLCMIPHRRSYRDTDTLLLVQGFEPYSYAELVRHLTGRAPGSKRDRVRGVWLAPFRVATNLRAHRRAERRRLLVASDPCLVTHMEKEWLAPGTDWRAVAQETRAWALDRHLIDGIHSPV
jgi:hypothetical protein